MWKLQLFSNWFTGSSDILTFPATAIKRRGQMAWGRNLFSHIILICCHMFSRALRRCWPNLHCHNQPWLLTLMASNIRGYKDLFFFFSWIKLEWWKMWEALLPVRLYWAETTVVGNTPESTMLSKRVRKKKGEKTQRYQYNRLTACFNLSHYLTSAGYTRPVRYVGDFILG